MESASLLAFTGALPPLPLGLASVDMTADEKSEFCRSTTYEGQRMMFDAKVHTLWSEWSEWSRRDAGMVYLVDAVVQISEVRKGRKV